MATHALTYVYDEDACVACIYRHFDGYPSHHGRQLGEFIKSIKIQDGGLGDERLYSAAYGIGCFAAQLVASMKDSVGDIYLRPTDDERNHALIDFVYRVYYTRDEGWRIVVSCGDNKTAVIECGIDAFLEFCVANGE